MRLGDLVRVHRRSRGLTQEELAGKAGVSVRTIRDIESGRVLAPRPHTVRLIATALELDGLARKEFDSVAAEADAGPDPAPIGATARETPTQPRVRPAELPLAIAEFIGRDAALAVLDDAQLAAWGSRSTAMICVLCGPAGVGKTALAVHWSHRVRRWFDGGQLYLDLRGYPGAPALRPLDALTRLLRSLGVPADRLPADVDEAAALFRSLLADQRILLVLDNARNAEQVRPLLPGGGACSVLVTSRDELPGLVAREGARRIAVDPLSRPEAQELLARFFAGQGIEISADEAAELAWLCDYLPAVLRAVAASMVSRGGRLAEQLRRLHDGLRPAATRLTPASAGRLGADHLPLRAA